MVKMTRFYYYFALIYIQETCYDEGRAYDLLIYNDGKYTLFIDGILLHIYSVR